MFCKYDKINKDRMKWKQKLSAIVKLGAQTGDVLA
jgi:hypothetical protein